MHLKCHSLVISDSNWSLAGQKKQREDATLGSKNL